MNRPLTLAAAVLAAGAMVVGATGCSFGGEDDPAISTTGTQPAATVTEQTTVTEQNQNQDDQNQNQDQDDQAEGEAIGNAAESAGLSEAKKECLANAPSAADCANIP